MSEARFIVGDVFEVLAGIPDGSIDLVLTSPPFLALRSYLPADHPDKAKELGSELTPGAFIDTLLALTEEWARVLAPHGSLCVELGDTYSGSGGAGGDYNENGLREGQERFDGSGRRRPVGRDHAHNPANYSTNGHREGWPAPKSLCLIPELYRISLVYGFNPLTGRPAPTWRARNVVRWCRPNPPVGALGDKVRPATSDMVVACKGGTRWFDLDAVRTEAIDQRFRTTNGPKGLAADPAEVQTGNYTTRVPSNAAGAPPLDHWWHDDVFDQDAWLIPTQPYKGAHYATWPDDLCVKPIEAMCPRKVCLTCGLPSERIPDTNGWFSCCGCCGHGPDTGLRLTTLDCLEDHWRNGIVLDPFAGSGTTLAVATGHGRDAIGIDLDERNADLARQRVGMFLEVVA